MHNIGVKRQLLHYSTLFALMLQILHSLQRNLPKKQICILTGSQRITFLSEELENQDNSNGKVFKALCITRSYRFMITLAFLAKKFNTHIICPN